MFSFQVNGQTHEVDVEPDTPLLWVLRDTLGLTGTKFGCGMALCGACTVHVDGRAVRSCVFPVSLLDGRKVTTIEGLGTDGPHPLQQAWLEENVPQCGYCQSGQIMSAAALLAETPEPTDDEICSGMSGNLCRCGTYQRVCKAIRKAAVVMKPLTPPVPEPAAATVAPPAVEPPADAAAESPPALPTQPGGAQ